jgi:hypothetical protein
MLGLQAVQKSHGVCVRARSRQTLRFGSSSTYILPGDLKTQKRTG